MVHSISFGLRFPSPLAGANKHFSPTKSGGYHIYSKMCECDISVTSWLFFSFPCFTDFPISGPILLMLIKFGSLKASQLWKRLGTICWLCAITAGQSCCKSSINSSAKHERESSPLWSVFLATHNKPRLPLMLLPWANCRCCWTDTWN